MSIYTEFIIYDEKQQRHVADCELNFHTISTRTNERKII